MRPRTPPRPPPPPRRRETAQGSERHARRPPGPAPPERRSRGGGNLKAPAQTAAPRSELATPSLATPGRTGSRRRPRVAEGTGSRALRANSLLRPETTCKSLPSRGGRGRGGGGRQLERRRGRGHDPLARAGAGSGRPSPAEGPRSRAPTTNGRAGGRHGVGHAAACARLRPAPTRALLLCGGGDDSARGLRRSRRPHPGRTQWSAAVLAPPTPRAPAPHSRRAPWCARAR